MKKLLGLLWLSLFSTFFIFTSCEQPQKLSDDEFRESLSEIKQQMQVASDLLDEAISAEKSSQLIEKSDDALNIIDKQLDAYMDETDKAVRRIDKDTRSGIIDIKQKVVETDFRLALLENNEQFRISEHAEDYDEIPKARRTRPVHYRFPQIPEINGRYISEMVEYGAEVMEEVRTNLQELRSELDLFIEKNL